MDAPMAAHSEFFLLIAIVLGVILSATCVTCMASLAQITRSLESIKRDVRRQLTLLDWMGKHVAALGHEIRAARKVQDEGEDSPEQ